MIRQSRVLYNVLKVIYLEYKHTIQLCADSPNDFKNNDQVIKRIFKNE